MTNPNKYIRDNVWVDHDNGSPPEGFPKVARKDLAPPVQGNAITGGRDNMLPRLSKSQKARQKKTKL